MLIRFEIESKLKMFIECRNLRTIFLEKLKHVGLYETEKSDIYSVKQVQKVQNNFCCSGFFIFNGETQTIKCDADERRCRRLDGGKQLFLPQTKMQTNLDTRKIITPAQNLSGGFKLSFDTVFGGNGCLAQKDDQNNNAGKRNQTDKDPCPLFACVPQTSDGNGNAGNQCCQSVEGTEDGKGRQNGCNKAQCERCDHVKEKCHPITADRCSAAKVGVILPHIQIFFHNYFLLFFYTWIFIIYHRKE